MTPRLRLVGVCLLALALLYVQHVPLRAQAAPKYAITVMPPGGPAPRLPDGHPDLSGHWLPNSAGQGVGGRDGVDPAARRQFDPKVLMHPWKSAPRRWTLGNGEVYEFYCTNNRELDELGKLKEQESYAK